MNKGRSFPFNRWGINLALILALAGLVFYGYQKNPAITLQMCLSNPLKYDGQEISVAQEARVVHILSDGFLVKQMGRTIRVKGNPQNASPGDFVRIKAVFHKENFLVIERLYVAKGRQFKIIVSVLPALFVFYLFLRAYQFDGRSMLFKRRP